MQAWLSLRALSNKYRVVTWRLRREVFEDCLPGPIAEPGWQSLLLVQA